METKSSLKRYNEYLKIRLDEQRQEIRDLHQKIRDLSRPDTDVNWDLQSKYLVLCNKYNKLMESCSSNDTEYITYNGELYGIKSIDYHKEPDAVDSLNIEAIHIPKEKGLINNLAEPLKNVGKEINKIFFGNENK